MKARRGVDAFRSMSLLVIVDPFWSSRLIPRPVLFVADLFHPVGTLAVQHLHNGDMGHRGGGCGAMPVLLTGREPDHISRPNFLNRAAPALYSTTTGRHNQGLSQRVCVPCCSSAGLEGDTGAEHTRRSGRIEQRSEERRVGKECRSRWSPYH